MKKVIILLLAFVAFANINAQDVKRGGTKGTEIAVSDFLLQYTGIAGDTISTNRDSLAVAWYVPKPQSQFYDFEVKLNEVTAGGRAGVLLQGKKFNNASWATITTVNYAGTLSTGADTTIYYTQTSTKQFYNYYRILVIYTAAKTKITSISGVLKNQ